MPAVEPASGPAGSPPSTWPGRAGAVSCPRIAPARRVAAAPRRHGLLGVPPGQLSSRVQDAFRPGAPGRRTRRSAPTRPCASSFPRRAARTGASADRGRHFPAMEAPGQFAARLQAFFAPPQNRCPAL